MDDNRRLGYYYNDDNSNNNCNDDKLSVIRHHDTTLQSRVINSHFTQLMLPKDLTVAGLSVCPFLWQRVNVVND